MRVIIGVTVSKIQCVGQGLVPTGLSSNKHLALDMASERSQTPEHIAPLLKVDLVNPLQATEPA